MTRQEGVVGVLLAGGLSRRMGGGDKCLRPLAGKPILEHVIDRIKPQVGTLVLNANGDPARFADYDLPVAADLVEGFAGPLAGVLTGLRWAAEHRPDCPWVATVATDAPFLPRDLGSRLVQAVEAEAADMACAASNGRSQPVIGLWPVRLADALEEALVERDIRKVDLWTAEYKLAQVDFPVDGIDPFFNTNRPEDLAQAEELLRQA
jgi:molybdopterin-guanine dinucleotide biosynthesis protein A